MAKSTYNQIPEGFICPICYIDFRSPANLLTHFEDLHSEEQDLLKSIKGLVGKAKKKILKLDENDLESFKIEISLQEFDLKHTELQEPGLSRSHIQFFKYARRDRLELCTSETNSLILKLYDILHIEGSDRKQQEQKVATWLDGTTVFRCPSCAAVFNLTRRQHHCRLCGSIMCNACSHFLSHEVAKTMVAPIFAGMRSIDIKTEENIRLCTYCINMLENRYQAQILQLNQPPICELYARLQKIKADLQPSINLYEKMYNSFMSGEDTFLLQDALTLRSSIAQHAEILDTISKRIMAASPENDSPKTFLLQHSIRLATTQYIKEYLLVLPNLPNPIELDKIRKNRAAKNVSTFQQPNLLNVKKIAVMTGWSPDNASIEQVMPEMSHDPLIEQINIVRNYIQQAKSANRNEEVVSLEENLKFLKKAYQSIQLNSGVP